MRVIPARTKVTTRAARHAEPTSEPRPTPEALAGEALLTLADLSALSAFPLPPSAASRLIPPVKPSPEPGKDSLSALPKRRKTAKKEGKARKPASTHQTSGPEKGYGAGETVESTYQTSDHQTIHELMATERPRERLLQYGASVLMSAELLAIILRTGTTQDNVLTLSSKLLARYNGLPGLARASIGELCNEYGVGEAKAIQIKAAFELGKRLAAAQPEERIQIKSPADAANLLMLDMAYLDQEHLKVILLNTKNHVLGTPTVYIGSVNMSVVRVGEIFKAAIKQNCPAIIVVHNHPSGDPTPSPEDVRVTEQMVEAGKLLDIEVLDHLIIGQQRFVSLKERRLGFH